MTLIIYSDHLNTTFCLFAHHHQLQGAVLADKGNSGILYLSTIHTPQSKALLEKTTTWLLAASASKGRSLPQCLYQLYYEQKSSTGGALAAEGHVLDFPPPSVSLTFTDTILDPVQEAWRRALGETAEEDDVQYMVFADREGVGDEDDYE